MVTRIYLPSSGDAPIAPAWDAAWDVTAGADRVRAVANLASGTAIAGGTKSTSESEAGPCNVLIRQYIVGPLPAGAIAGTIKGRIRADDNGADDLRAQMVVRVVSADGLTVRGTLRAADAEALSSAFASNDASRAFPLAALEPQALSSVTAQADDWLVIELGYRAHNTTTDSATGSLLFGDDATSDLPEDETTATALNAWIEFSQDIPIQKVDVQQVVAETAFRASGQAVRVRQALAEVGHWYHGTAGLRVRQVMAEVAWGPATGAIYTKGVDLGEYTGDLRGVPLSSDRAAWDDVNYPTRHARGMAAGDSHHAEVTLGASSDPALTLSGQELTLADVLTPAEHAAADHSGYDATAIHEDESGEIHAIAEKETPEDNDEVLIEDSGASYVKKRVKIANLPAGSGGSGTLANAGYQETVGDGVNTEFTVTHSLGTWDVLVQVYDLGVTPREQVGATVEVSSADAVVVTFESAPDADQYRVLVVAADVSAVSDAGDVTYTPTTLTDWYLDTDPGNANDALDQLAERVDDLEGAYLADHDHSGDAGDGGTFDAANLTSGAATNGQVLTADGSGGAAWEDAAAGGGDMTNPMTTAEDLIVGGVGGAPGRLAKGTDGQVLKMVAGAVAWGTDETSAGGGADEFTDLTDAPASYVGQGGKYVAVKITEDGLEFL